MNFSKTYLFESKTYPGVKIRLWRIGPVKRAELEIQTASARSRRNEILGQFLDADQELQPHLDALPKDEDGKPIISNLPKEVFDIGMRRQDLQDQADIIMRQEISPVFLKAAIVSMQEGEAITADGELYDTETLCAFGPEYLFSEIAKAIDQNTYYGAGVAANLSSPTTSGAQVDGKTTSTSAQTAKTVDSTQSETVVSTSPSE